MRITARSPVGTVTGAGGTRRTGGTGFVPETAEETRAASSGAASTGVGGIDALLVLQGGEDPSQRRRRTAKRGRDILDALDGLRAAILAGRIAPAEMLRIRRLLMERREGTDDPRLDEVLAHIELRAEVELAKLAREAAAR